MADPTESRGPDPESGNTGPRTLLPLTNRRGLDFALTLNTGGQVRLIGRELSAADMREVLRIIEASLEDE